MGERYISTDRMSGARYVSCRLPAQRQSLVSWLSHVCVRSLSCEVSSAIAYVGRNIYGVGPTNLKVVGLGPGLVEETC